MSTFTSTQALLTFQSAAPYRTVSLLIHDLSLTPTSGKLYSHIVLFGDACNCDYRRLGVIFNNNQQSNPENRRSLKLSYQEKCLFRVVTQMSTLTNQQHELKMAFFFCSTIWHNFLSWYTCGRYIIESLSLRHCTHVVRQVKMV